MTALGNVEEDFDTIKDSIEDAFLEAIENINKIKDKCLKDLKEIK